MNCESPTEMGELITCLRVSKWNLKGGKVYIWLKNWKDNIGTWKYHQRRMWWANKTVKKSNCQKRMWWTNILRQHTTHSQQKITSSLIDGASTAMFKDASDKGAYIHVDMMRTPKQT